jgi:LysR family hydrogen peroxide-inducible transcriptional activator
MEYLVAIADMGTFSAAAKKTFVSQPSMSAQIKDMEDHIGMALLERGRHGALLTPIGKEIVARSRIVLRQVEEMKVLGREAGGTLAGRIKLGVLPSVGPYLLPQATRKLHKAYPDLRLFVREERTVDLQDHLTSGYFDAIISSPEEHPDTRTIPLVTENIYICVAPDDPLAVSRDPVEMDALEGREFLTLGHGHKFGTTVKNLAALAKATTSDEYEGTSLDAIRQMAAMGGGVAILPSLYAISEAKRDPQLIVRPIHHPLARRDIALIWRHSSPLAKKFEKVGEVFVDVARDIMV